LKLSQTSTKFRGTKQDRHSTLDDLKRFDKQIVTISP
jgi:hypothetical protein